MKLLDRRSKLSPNHIIPICKTVLKPMWICWTVGLSETFQHFKNPLLTIQDPSHHCVCPVICVQSQPSHIFSNSLGQARGHWPLWQVSQPHNPPPHPTYPILIYSPTSWQSDWEGSGLGAYSIIYPLIKATKEWYLQFWFVLFCFLILWLFLIWFLFLFSSISLLVIIFYLFFPVFFHYAYLIHLCLLSASTLYKFYNWQIKKVKKKLIYYDVIKIIAIDITITIKPPNSLGIYRRIA